MNILITFELILLGLNILIVGISFFLDDLMGQIYSLIILTISAAECSIGLALVIVYYRVRGGISIDIINLLKS